MIIDEIILSNFGVFGGRQCIALTPPSLEKPVILIGGLNGAGKTTLIDAIQLCLYGPFAQCSNRGSLSYQDYLRRCVHGQVKDEETNIEFEFRYRVDGEERRYRVKRSWLILKNRVREQFSVLLNGTKDPVLTANWVNQVHEFLPSNIANLFLFDGEKIEGYVDEVYSADLIGSAIENLLGLDIVDQLSKDLETFERRKRSEQQDSGTQIEIEAAESELGVLNSQLEGLQKERATDYVLKLTKKRRALEKAESQYRKLGGDLYDQRQSIEDRKHEAVRQVESGLDSLKETATGELPLMLVCKFLVSVAKQDKKEEDGRLARGIINTLEKRDAEFLERIHKMSLDKDVIENIKQIQFSDRESRKKQSHTRNYLNLSSEAQSRLHTLLDDSLNGAFRKAQSLITEQKQLELKLDQVNTEFDNIPAPDTLENILNQRESLINEIAEIEAELGVLDGSIGRLQRDIERKHLEYARLLNENAEGSIKNEEQNRIISHTSKVQGTLNRFRLMVIQRHLKRIEELVLQSYQQLLHKTSLVSRLTIEPERFQLTLYDKEGSQIQIPRLSAGERQLLGVALLWGLGKASGRPLPTAIDTPLGRLDTTHRSHLVEHYFPFASHQVLLLSTDEEITGEYLQKLNPWIGRKYQLIYDDKLGRTSITPGYFEELNQTYVN